MTVPAYEFDVTSKEVKIYHLHLQIQIIGATAASGLAVC